MKFTVYNSLVTLAVQNSLLTIIMHYSRVSIPASRTYSAATAVLMNEILKGSISLVIAFTRVESGIGSSSLDSPREGHCRRTAFAKVKKLGRDVFSADCWKLSIPAILYGKHTVDHDICRQSRLTRFQLSKIIYNTSRPPTWMQQPSKSVTR